MGAGGGHAAHGSLNLKTLNPTASPWQVRVWVPAAVMRRAQARLVAGGPREQVLTVELRSDFHITHAPLEVTPYTSYGRPGS